MNTFLMIVLTLLILTVLVVVHEFGHFIVARKTGVYVIEFAIGMGPKIFSRKVKETIFSVRLFPIGGFCRLLGEDSEEDLEEFDLPEDLDESRYFSNKGKGQKILILVAGAAMNFIFAFLCILLVYLGRNVAFFPAILRSFKTIGEFSGLIYQSLYQLVAGQLGLNDFAGPIGMVGMVQSFVQYGFLTLVSFTALISVNLGVINLLPIPALDGGQIFIALVELIVRRDLSPQKANLINLIGFGLMMFLAIIVAVNDVLRIING